MDHNLEAIKKAIGGLPDHERAALASWLNLNEMDDWDREMQRDFSEGGKAHGLAARIRAQIRQGEFAPMSLPDANGNKN